VNSVHLCTTDYLLSLSDTGTNSEHLPIADIANRESIHVWKVELNSLIRIAWQVHMCTPNFISSPSWLPSPRFELQTLAGYILPQEDVMVCYGNQHAR